MFKTLMQGFQNKAPHDASVGYLSKFGISAVATFPRMIKENKQNEFCPTAYLSFHSLLVTNSTSSTNINQVEFIIIAGKEPRYSEYSGNVADRVKLVGFVIS